MSTIQIMYTGADTGFGRGRGQEIFRWDNGVSREATEGGLGGGGGFPKKMYKLKCSRSDSERT